MEEGWNSTAEAERQIVEIPGYENWELQILSLLVESLVIDV